MPTAVGTYATAAAVKTRLGITDASDDTLLGTLCDQMNQYIETKTGRVLAPVGSATYTFDGDGGRRLYVARGVRAVTLLEIALYTGGDYSTVDAGDYVLRPQELDRDPGWPATSIVLVDRPVGLGYFPAGYSTVRVTMTTGWASIPDDIAELATTAVVRAWHSRQAGQTDVIGSDEFGRPIVSRYLSRRDNALLDFYSAHTARVA